MPVEQGGLTGGRGVPHPSKISFSSLAINNLMLQTLLPDKLFPMPEEWPEDHLSHIQVSFTLFLSIAVTNHFITIPMYLFQTLLPDKNSLTRILKRRAFWKEEPRSSHGSRTNQTLPPSVNRTRTNKFNSWNSSESVYFLNICMHIFINHWKFIWKIKLQTRGPCVLNISISGIINNCRLD